MSDFENPEFAPGDEIPGGNDNPSDVPEGPASQENSGGVEPSATSASDFDWSDLFEVLPDEFKELTKPALSKYEQRFKEQQEQYSRFDSFKDVDPEHLAAGISIFNHLNTEEGARQIYEELGKVLGVTPEKAEQIVEATAQTTPDPDIDPEDEDPRDKVIRELQTKVNGIQEFFTKQEYEGEVARQQEAIDKSLNTLMKADPTLKPQTPRMNDLLLRADYLINTNYKGDVVREAYRLQREYNDSLIGEVQARTQNDPNNRAPIHMTPTGGNPGSGVDPSSRTEDQRREAFAARLQQEANRTMS